MVFEDRVEVGEMRKRESVEGRGRRTIPNSSSIAISDVCISRIYFDFGSTQLGCLVVGTIV